eukprot:TRINITY_DN3038_c0_g1_i2.p1 TRINITY_DN3038_c0_g1~~TRINITY_DN3038_c0_g1_i2.p1  ORF type:complete len:332 (-),score=53.77 TRINITY_DN3038_c0_g1_i2:135-1130(-)
MAMGRLLIITIAALLCGAFLHAHPSSAQVSVSSSLSEKLEQLSSICPSDATAHSATCCSETDDFVRQYYGSLSSEKTFQATNLVQALEADVLSACSIPLPVPECLLGNIGILTDLALLNVTSECTEGSVRTEVCCNVASLLLHRYNHFPPSCQDEVDPDVLNNATEFVRVNCGVTPSPTPSPTHAPSTPSPTPTPANSPADSATPTSSPSPWAPVPSAPVSDESEQSQPDEDSTPSYGSEFESDKSDKFASDESVSDKSETSHESSTTSDIQHWQLVLIVLGAVFGFLIIVAVIALLSYYVYSKYGAGAGASAGSSAFSTNINQNQNIEAM